MTLLPVQGPSSQKRPRRLRQSSPPCYLALIGALIEAAVAAALAVPLDELRSPSRRTARTAFARQCAMYLAHTALSLDYRTAGLLFERDRTTAAHACHVVEARRDDPGTDRLLTMLERICAELALEVRS